MECMSSNIEIPGRDFVYRSQLINWVLDSGATFHMIPEISYFVPVSLVGTDKYIEVANGGFSQLKTGEFQIKNCDDNGKPLTSTLYVLLSSPDFCDKLFSIIVFMNLVKTFLFHRGFCTVLSDFYAVM